MQKRYVSAQHLPPIRPAQAAALPKQTPQRSAEEKRMRRRGAVLTYLRRQKCLFSNTEAHLDEILNQHTDLKAIRAEVRKRAGGPAKRP